MDVTAVLREQFRFDAFRPGQEAVIDRLMAGRGAVAIFPTGSGKSLCYQLPSQLLEGMTLVVSPLLALMKDQIDALRAKGIEATRLDSSLSEEDYRAVTADIRAGRVKLLYVSPERLGNERFLNLIRRQRISLLAVDEAHCISAWGHNFRPDYLKLAQAARDLQVERVLALTATATPRVSDDIAEAFGIAPDDVINTGFHRPNLELRVTGCLDPERPDLLVRRLKERPAGPTIVYVHLQRHAEEVAEALVAAGFDAAPYHAGMASERRVETQEAFMSGQRPIICATIAFGMGVDKADIRYVYHYHLPKGFESYQQEIGRAGRDGEPSVCELFACEDDCTTLENFAYGDTPDPASIAGMVDEILDEGEVIDVSTYELSRRHDMRTLVVNTLLTRLELMEVIRSEGFYYSSVKFAPKLPGREILKRYDEKQAVFLKAVFRCCSKAKTWVTLDMSRAVAETGQGRDVILRALESLQEKGLADLRTAGYRQRFRRLVAEVDREELCGKLEAAFAAHERMEIERISSMIDFAAHSGCLTAKLLGYFGEEIAKCGHCGICLGDPPAEVPARGDAEVDPGAIGGFDELVRDHPEALGRPRQQARFLCGLNSPAISADRALRRHPLFGALAEVPFGRVLASREGRGGR